MRGEPRQRRGHAGVEGGVSVVRIDVSGRGRDRARWWEGPIGPGGLGEVQLGQPGRNLWHLHLRLALRYQQAVTHINLPTVHHSLCRLFEPACPSAMTSSPSGPVDLSTLSLAPTEQSQDAPPPASTSAATPALSEKPAKPARSARGRPSDDADTRHSKTLSYILRHGASKEGLTLRPDGFVRVSDLVSPLKTRTP